MKLKNNYFFLMSIAFYFSTSIYAQDTIITIDNSRMVVKIVEVHPDRISYINSGSNSTEIQEISISTIAQIKYSNGIIESYTQKKAINTASQPNDYLPKNQTSLSNLKPLKLRKFRNYTFYLNTGDSISGTYMDKDEDTYLIYEKWDISQNIVKTNVVNFKPCDENINANKFIFYDDENLLNHKLIKTTEVNDIIIKTNDNDLIQGSQKAKHFLRLGRGLMFAGAAPAAVGVAGFLGMALALAVGAGDDLFDNSIILMGGGLFTAATIELIAIPIFKKGKNLTQKVGTEYNQKY